MVIQIIAVVIRVVWLVVEYSYLRGHRVSTARNWDKNSAKLWDIAHGIECVGIVLGFVGIGRIQVESNSLGILGLALLLAGVAMRGASIYALGKYFTGIVLIKEDHRLIRSGPYRHLRHPAYTGALLAHLGLGLSFTNWFSLALSVVPYIVAVIYRMHVEEKALRDAFGSEYLTYAKDTKRLIPKVY